MANFFLTIRWIPVLVSRNPIECILCAVLLASVCWHYLTTHFGRPLLALGGASTVASQWTGGRLAWDGGTWHTDSTDEPLPFPYWHVESMWVQPAPEAIGDIKGALTRRSFRALFALKNKIEHDVFMRDDLGSNFTLWEHLRPVYAVAPTALWNHSVEAFAAEPDVLERIALTDSVFVKPSTTLTNIKALRVARSALFHDVTVDGKAETSRAGRASALVLSYVFNVTSEHQAQMLQSWRRKVGAIRTDAVVAQSLVRDRASHRHRPTTPTIRLAAFASGIWAVKEIIEVLFRCLIGFNRDRIRKRLMYLSLQSPTF
jgi:hypothetical protein